MMSELKILLSVSQKRMYRKWIAEGSEDNDGGRGDNSDTAISK